METLTVQHGYKIEFNGSSTYFITDSMGQNWYMVKTLRKAKNRLKRILKGENKEFKNFK